MPSAESKIAACGALQTLGRYEHAHIWHIPESKMLQKREGRWGRHGVHLCCFTHILCWQKLNQVSGLATPFSKLSETAFEPHFASASCLHSSLSCMQGCAAEAAEGALARSALRYTDRSHPDLLVNGSKPDRSQIILLQSPTHWGGKHTLPRSRKALQVETTDNRSQISKNANVRSVASIDNESREAGPLVPMSMS